MRLQSVHHTSVAYAPLHSQPQSLHLSSAAFNLALFYNVPYCPFQRFLLFGCKYTLTSLSNYSEITLV